ncbi:MAG: discoidin domain-containing protein, partial [Acidimicrobiia bacterium]
GSEPTVPPTTEAPVVASDAAPATIVPAASDITHLVGKVSASSELSTEFGADRLIDGDFERGWHDASLRGVGAEIVLEFTEPVAITEIVVYPYTDEERFARNYWVDLYEIRTDDLVPTITGKLANHPEPQVVLLGTNETSTLTFTVVTTYPALPYGDDPPYDEPPPYDELAIAEIQVFGTPISDTAESTATTTITIVADPQLPPALRGTPLTTAWREYVIETMAMAEYEITDMDVFEKEMDRGLVHATFTTVDGNEWAVAFGPWRDGEYSDDPSVLQEQFSTEKPGQETAEGLLLTSERTNPSYVYLAMDVGKIAISVQPDITGSAVPLKDLEALALDLAPIARLLLEADLIEWNT